uniref:Methyltransferase type 11 domain-containing protein n=1 Tax=Anser brachyrhynchus TaxID=132585 RepID=A0A8B9CSX2_9AVES
VGSERLGVFPYIMAQMAPAYNHKVYKQKQALFSNLRTFAGPSGQLTFLSENRHLQLERSVVASGEDLHQIPDGSMDVVVSTLVLCSVSSVRKVLAEVLRVLRRGGAFYFLEHVAADHSSWTYFWQKVFDPLWKCFGDGCSLSRETQKELEKTNFSELNLKQIYVTPYWIPSSPHIIGYAVK